MRLKRKCPSDGSELKVIWNEGFGELLACHACNSYWTHAELDMDNAVDGLRES